MKDVNHSRMFCWISIVICSLMAIVSILFTIAINGGSEYTPVRLISSLLAIYMLWGVYRGLFHLLAKPRKRLHATHMGIEYNVVPVPAWKVLLDFFNPAKMRIRTVSSLFFIAVALVCAKYYGMSAVWYVIPIIAGAAAKGYLLFMELRYNYAKNLLGREILDICGLYCYCHDVTEQLINSPETVPENIIDPILPFVNTAGTYADYVDNISQFSLAQRHLFAAYWYIYAINGDDNDGHDSYFRDVAGVMYIDAIEGLKAIGATELATVLECAAAKFDGISNPLFDVDQRCEAIDSRKIDFSDDDDAFFNCYDDGAQIEEMLMAYVRSHAGDFLFHSPLSR